MTAGVYAITNTQTGEQYVGSSQDVELRFRNHAQLLGRGKHHCPRLQAAWTEYGWEAFTFKIIERSDTPGTPRGHEFLWIAKLQPAYNVTEAEVIASRRKSA